MLSVWRGNPTSSHLLHAWHWPEQRKSSWAGSGLIPSYHLPLKKDFTEFVLPPASIVENYFNFISLHWLPSLWVMALHILAPHVSAARQRLSMTWICLFSISRDFLSTIVERDKEWKCPNVYSFLQQKIQNMFLVTPQDRLLGSTATTDAKKSAWDRTSRKSQTQIRATQVCTSLNKTELK